MFRFSRYAAMAAVLLLLIGCQAPVTEPVKVAFVYVGLVGDHGWSHQHDQARIALEDHFGDKIETAFVENVEEGPSSTRLINQFAQQGFDLVFTTSFGFMNPTLKVAQNFPNMKFEQATGYKQADNLATYAARFYEGHAVTGTIAGHMTKSNIVGFIAPFPVPEVVRGINAFTIALRNVNPKAEVKVIWTNSWYDLGREREAAEALIAQGADILSQHTDSAAPIQVAQEKGVFTFGQASDMSRFGPDAHLTAVIHDWVPYYTERVQAVIDGTWKSTNTWGGFDNGMVVMAPYNDKVPADVRAAAEDIKEAIRTGRYHPFQGPITNQAGELVVKEGEVLGDDALLSMSWYVQGVQDHGTN